MTLRKGYSRGFLVELKKEEVKKLDRLCKLHNRSKNKEIETMIRYYYSNHLRTENYF